MDFFRADKPLPPVPPEARRLASAFGAKVSSLASAAGQAASNAKQRATSASAAEGDGRSAFDMSRARALFEGGSSSASQQQQQSEAARGAAAYAARNVPVRSAVDLAKHVPTDAYVSALRSSHPNAAGRLPLASAIDAAKKVDTDTYVKAYDAAPKERIAAAVSAHQAPPGPPTTVSPPSSSVRALRSQLETQLHLGDRRGAPPARPATSPGAPQHSPVPVPTRAPPPPPSQSAKAAVGGCGSIGWKDAEEMSEPRAVALYDFDAQNFDELACQKGDSVLLKKRVDADWAYCQNGRSAMYGIVPLAFLDVKVDLPVESQSPARAYAGTAEAAQHVAGPRCTVQYDFASGVPGDLPPCRTGTQLALLSRVDAEWLRCRMADGSEAEGIIPATFVCVDVEGEVQTVKAAYDYEPGSKDDLGFKVGDRIDVYECVDAQWLRGRLARHPTVFGIFPANFVEQTTFTPPTSAAHSGNTQCAGQSWVGQTCVALWDYRGDSQDDLWFSAGDRIRIIEEVGEEWLRGRLVLDLANSRNLPTGMFPKSFVQLQ